MEITMKLSYILMFTTIIACHTHASTKDDTNNDRPTATISAWTEDDQRRSDERERQEVYSSTLYQAFQTGSEMPFADAEIAVTRHDASKK